MKKRAKKLAFEFTPVGGFRYRLEYGWRCGSMKDLSVDITSFDANDLPGGGAVILRKDVRGIVNFLRRCIARMNREQSCEGVDVFQETAIAASKRKK